MRIYVQSTPGALTVSLEGVASSVRDSLAESGGPLRQLEDQLRHARGPIVVVDFRDLRQVDAACFRSLLEFFRGETARRKVKLVGPGGAARRVLALLTTPPPVRFFPSIAAARGTFATSLDASDEEWNEFLAQFRPAPAAGRGLQDFRSRLGREFVVDLAEEEAYLRSEGESPWNSAPRWTLQFRRSSTDPVTVGAVPFDTG